MTAAIHFEAEAYQITHGKPMGRHFAGHGFLSAVARHANASALTGYVRNAKAGDEFRRFINDLRPDRKTHYIAAARAGGLKRIGCLFTPSPINAAQAWQRELHGSNAWSLCGVNHTLSSARAMDGLSDLLTAPIQPWDAIICTSTASRSVIETLFSRQEEYLSRRLGASRFVRPQLPVIPLGVDCDSQARHSRLREQARRELGITPGDFVVLFLGRLSFHAKANPAPMYVALERLAARHRVVLVECGWTANDQIAQAFTDARAKLCPSVRAIVLDGRESSIRTKAWASADVFCSLSDNIQETFGLTPIEAMAAGLPVVVTDWDGYKDTVRNGIDGFAVPTMTPPPGVGQPMAIRHALEVDSYDSYIGQASTAIVVDVDATALAFERLAADPELRRRMGASGAARARELFDWKIIVKAYEELWAELARMRSAAEAPSSRSNAAFWPARPDPFELFAGFPTASFTALHKIVPAAGVDEAEVSQRLALKIALVSATPDLSADLLLDLWRRIGPEGAAARNILTANQDVPPVAAIHGLMLLAKLGLVKILAPA